MVFKAESDLCLPSFYSSRLIKERDLHSHFPWRYHMQEDLRAKTLKKMYSTISGHTSPLWGFGKSSSCKMSVQCLGEFFPFNNNVTSGCSAVPSRYFSMDIIKPPITEPQGSSQEPQVSIALTGTEQCFWACRQHSPCLEAYPPLNAILSDKGNSNKPRKTVLSQRLFPY